MRTENMTEINKSTVTAVNMTLLDMIENDYHHQVRHIEARESEPRIEVQ